MEIKNLRALNTNATSDSTGNYYPRHVVEKAVEVFLEKKKDNQVFGELRPRNVHITTAERQMQILGSEMSHELLDLRLDGDTLVADILVLDLPAGNLLKKIVPLDHEELYAKSKEELGFMLGLRSLVSYSSNMQDMQNKQVDFLDIITFDVIYDPLKFPDLYPGVLFHNGEDECVIPNIWWERDEERQCVFHATLRSYVDGKDYKLMIQPADGVAFQGLVDGVVVAGAVSLDELELKLMQHINPSHSLEPKAA